MTDDERETRAFEAIIVSQLLREGDPTNLDDLPELTKEQKEKIDALPEDLVDRLWEAARNEQSCPSEETCDVMEDEEEFVGMNRAEEMDEETRNQLEAARKEVRDSMRKQQKDDDGANG